MKIKKPKNRIPEEWKLVAIKHPTTNEKYRLSHKYILNIGIKVSAAYCLIRFSWLLYIFVTVKKIKNNIHTVNSLFFALTKKKNIKIDWSREKTKNNAWGGALR